jgi:hypothetical protein
MFNSLGLEELLVSYIPGRAGCAYISILLVSLSISHLPQSHENCTYSLLLSVYNLPLILQSFGSHFKL